MVVEVILECQEHNYMCTLTTEIAQHLLNQPFLYSCTLNNLGIPFIRPIMYNYEMDKCQISFLSAMNSQEIKNLKNNKNISFTTETNHPTNPFMNSGIMIQSSSNLENSESEKMNLRRSLHKKYSSHLIPEVVDYYSNENDIVVNAEIIKISYWKGPKFKQFVCKYRNIQKS